MAENPFGGREFSLPPNGFFLFLPQKKEKNIFFVGILKIFQKKFKIKKYDNEFKQGAFDARANHRSE